MNSTEGCVQIRAFEGGLSELLLLEGECFQDPWTPSMFKECIGSDCCILLTAYLGGQLCGYICASFIAPEAEILSLAVLPKARKRGIASALMNEFITKCREEKVTDAYLEVRESNIPAKSLYEKYSFKAVGRRKNYYRLPREDALVMHLNLQSIIEEGQTFQC